MASCNAKLSTATVTQEEDRNATRNHQSEENAKDHVVTVRATVCGSNGYAVGLNNQGENI